ncbi:MAG: SDR family oxidoreductase [Pseudomonadota bacterium]
MRFTNQRGLVMVTGATGGIGSAVCQHLYKIRLSPLVCHRKNSTDKAAELADKFGGISLPLDLGDAQSIDSAISLIKGMKEKFIGVVHCASPSPHQAPLAQVSEDDMEMFWKINVMGPRRLLAGIVKERLRKEREGVIVAIMSAAMGNWGANAMPGLGAYTISKFGLLGVLALLEAENKWLRVVTVNPGFTRTGMLSAFDDRFIELACSQKPLAEPGEIAADIVSQFEG